MLCLMDRRLVNYPDEAAVYSYVALPRNCKSSRIVCDSICPMNCNAVDGSARLGIRRTLRVRMGLRLKVRIELVLFLETCNV